MSEPAANGHPGAARIDRWLFAVRLFKSRSLAAQAVAGGRVHVNGERVKPAHEVRPGDRVSFARGTVRFECAVAAVPQRRGPTNTIVGCCGACGVAFEPPQVAAKHVGSRVTLHTELQGVSPGAAVAG